MVDDATNAATANTPPEKDGRFVCMAVITGPHGVSGALKLKCFADDMSALQSYNPFTTKTGDWEFVINVTAETKGQPVVRIDGIRTREQAEALKGLELYIPHSRLPETGEDEYYHEDLAGLMVISTQGAAIGKVVAVHDFGAGDIIEIEMAGPHKQKNKNKPAKPRRELLPFTKQTVKQVDIAAGCLILDMPEEEIVTAEAAAQEAELAD